VQASWQPGKRVEIYSRFRSKNKPVNEALPSMAFNFPQDKLLRNWRTHVSFHLSRNILLRNRIEFCWFGEPGQLKPETGFLLYTDVLFKPFGSWYSVSARLQVFETGGYNTRLYAYENDLLFSNSTPAFFDNGSRIYVNLKMKPGIKVFRQYAIDAGIKASVSVYSNKKTIGSGPDEIAGNHKSEIRMQILILSKQ
jgi:hypothetical protein